MINATPTEARILAALSDGMAHRTIELVKVIDPLATTKNLQDHVRSIRVKLREVGEDIVCEYAHRKFYYRHVRLLANPYDGYV